MGCPSARASWSRFGGLPSFRSKEPPTTASTGGATYTVAPNNIDIVSSADASVEDMSNQECVIIVLLVLEAASQSSPVCLFSTV